MGRPVNANVPEAGYQSKKQFENTGSIAASDFAVVSDGDNSTKITFDPSGQTKGKKVTISAGANSADIVLTLPTSSGTISTSSFAPKFYTGPQCSTNSSHLTASSYTTFDNSPTLTFTPTVTGTYKVYCSAPCILNPGGAESVAFRIKDSGGSPSVLTITEGTLYGSAGAGPLFSSTYLQSTFTLTSGTSYSFDIQGVVMGGTGTTYVEITGDTAKFYMYAELVG